jgi:hypothetical protein
MDGKTGGGDGIETLPEPHLEITPRVMGVGRRFDWA